MTRTQIPGSSLQGLPLLNNNKKNVSRVLGLNGLLF